MSEIRNPGKKCGIRINKEAFKNFVSEKGSDLKEISEVLGVKHHSIYNMLNRGTFTVDILDRLSSLFGVNPKDMAFIDDPAHRLLYQLCIPFDGPMQYGNKIARIREYLAQGLDRLKIRELLMRNTLTHSAVSAAFNNVANDSQKTIGQISAECAADISANIDAKTPIDPNSQKTLGTVISECAENLVAIDVDDCPSTCVCSFDFEDYLKNKEMKAAQTLASSVVEYFGRWSKVATTVNGDITLRLDKTETPVMQKEYHDWAVVRDICRDTGIVTKARPWLEVLYFMASNCVGIASRKEWEKAAHIIKFELSKESDFIGRYPIEKEEETNHEGN